MSQPVPGFDFDSYLVSTMAKIDRYGHVIQGVFPTINDPGPGFGYTVGLSAVGLPEIILVGLPISVMHSLLNEAAGLAKETPLTMSDPDRNALHPYDQIISHYPVYFIPAHTEHVGVAQQLYDNVTAIQLVWPDNQGRFPWDTTFDQSLVEVQPLWRNQ